MGMVFALAGVLAASPLALASCVPPAMITFKDDPNTVVVGGTILRVTPAIVTVAVELWWGVGPLEQVEIKRPPTDPTVITSTDWNPQPGEGWIIIAERDVDAFSTGVCQQLPDDQRSITEVVNSLGDPLKPALSSDPVPTAPANSDPPVGPIVIVAIMLLGVFIGVAMTRRKSSRRG